MIFLSGKNSDSLITVWSIKIICDYVAVIWNRVSWRGYRPVVEPHERRDVGLDFRINLNYSKKKSILLYELKTFLDLVLFTPSWLISGYDDSLIRTRSRSYLRRFKWYLQNRVFRTFGYCWKSPAAIGNNPSIRIPRARSPEQHVLRSEVEGGGWWTEKKH